MSAHAAALGGAIEDYRGLVEALSNRGYCFSHRATYDPIAPRSTTLSGRFVAPLAAAAAPAASASPLSSPARPRLFPGGQHHYSPASPGGGSGSEGDGAGEGDDSGAALEVALGGSVRRRTDVQTAGLLLGPVAVPVQEDLCRFWIERSTGIELDEARPLADALVSGMLLCRLIDVEPPARPPRVNLPTTISERNVAEFLREARARLADDAVLFEAQDLLYRRNTPRVLRTVAAVARATDPEGFGAVAADLSGARMQWTQADEPDECWDGDWLLRRLVQSYQRLSWDGKLGILVAGTQGSGKSATVDMVFGRQFMPPTHAFGFMPKDDEFLEPERRRIQMHRRASSLYWPHRLFERGVPDPLDRVCKLYVKIAGVSVRVTELPSMETHTEATEPNGLVVYTKTGTYEEVLAELQNDDEDLALLVERLDDFQRDRFRGLARKLHRMYGERLWARTIVVLTHGTAMPPDGLSFDELVAQQSHAVLCCIRDICGDSSVIVPVLVVENSQSCAVDSETGRPMMPNGADFQTRLLSTMEFVLARNQGSDPLRPSGMKQWWETYALGALAFFLVTRL
jgi:hypothetical protein